MRTTTLLADAVTRQTARVRCRATALSAAGLGLALAACSPNPDLSPGVSWELAEHRARTISDVHYQITLRLPASMEERIRARLVIRLSLSET